MKSEKKLRITTSATYKLIDFSTYKLHQERKSMLLNFFNKNQCLHKHIKPELDSGYCPDCGEYIQNHWFITRCSCCGVKQKTIIVKGKIVADVKYCKNCGSNSFVAEQLNKINLVDINYAVVIKQIIKDRKSTWTQTWVEQRDRVYVKLLPQHG